MKNIDKNVWTAIGIVAILVIVLFTHKVFKNKDVDTEVTAPEDSSSLVAPVVTNTKVAKKVAPKLPYNEAVAFFKDQRIQLGVDCQANPNMPAFKAGSSIMVDNRSGNTRTVKVGTMYNIKPWDYVVVKLDVPSIPDTWYVDCDQSQNVATILIQK